MRTGIWVGIVVAAFVVMEPVTALVHRYVMHGFGWSWHRDHHNPRTRGFERNDRYPVVFAVLVGLLLVLGGMSEALWWLTPLGYGITAYGVAYGVVHELAVHRRLGPLRPRGRWMQSLADAHATHHRTNGAPYGMLWPVNAEASGSEPSQVPHDAVGVSRAKHSSLNQP